MIQSIIVDGNELPFPPPQAATLDGKTTLELFHEDNSLLEQQEDFCGHRKIEILRLKNAQSYRDQLDRLCPVRQTDFQEGARSYPNYYYPTSEDHYEDVYFKVL